MSTKIQEKDWWTLFTHMSESKLKQRHNEDVNKFETNEKGYFFIQIYGTDFVKLSFQDEIGEALIEKVAKTKKKAQEIKKEYFKREGIQSVEITKNILRIPTYQANKKK